MRGAWGIKYWGKPHSMKKDQQSYEAQEAKNGPHRMENQVIEINRTELCDEKKILLWSKWGGYILMLLQASLGEAHQVQIHVSVGVT